MKVISWNLKNVSANKLKNTFQPKFASMGYGNNVLDYITNVVMAAPIWSGGAQGTPVDIFVVIELKTGGTAKGAAVSGQCVPTLTALCNALNSYATVNGLAGSYQYDAVEPKVTGYHETVGFIYNTITHKASSAAVVERDTITNTYLLPRTPLVATLEAATDPTNTIRISGIHDEPPSGADNVRMRIPIDYCRRLVNTPSAAIAKTFFLGDFNCQPANFYVNGSGVNVYPFNNLVPLGYNTDLPNGTLTSVRQSIDHSATGVGRYLSAAYDNIIFWTPGFAPKSEAVPNLIGATITIVPNNETAALNAYNTVSDHLPVIIEF